MLKARWAGRHDAPSPRNRLRKVPGKLPGSVSQALYTSLRPAPAQSSTLRRLDSGLSRVYCTMIQRGGYVPHPRHWEALEGMGG
jgi:hypothetical protein